MGPHPNPIQFGLARRVRETGLLSGALFAIGFLAFACAETTIDMNAKSASSDPKDYRDVFYTWSRSLKVIPLDGLDNVLTARATYLSDAFRDIYVTRVAADAEMSSGEREALRAEETARGAAGHEFFVTLLTGVEDCDDLTPEEGPWRIRLRDDRGREIAPLSVEEIDDPSARDIEYFDFDPDQRKAYRLLFPRTAGDGTPVLSPAIRFFELAFSSPYGKNSVRWETAAMAKAQ